MPEEWNKLNLPGPLLYKLRVYALSQMTTAPKLATEVLTKFLEAEELKGKPTSLKQLRKKG